MRKTIKQFRTDDGKTVGLDPERDELLFKSMYIGADAGMNLYLHKTEDGKEYFYQHGWSLRERTIDRVMVVDRDEALDFIHDSLKRGGSFAPDDDEMQRLEKLFPELRKGGVKK